MPPAAVKMSVLVLLALFAFAVWQGADPARSAVAVLILAAIAIVGRVLNPTAALGLALAAILIGAHHFGGA
jgi:hypothetical protein